LYACMCATSYARTTDDLTSRNQSHAETHPRGLHIERVTSKPFKAVDEVLIDRSSKKDLGAPTSRLGHSARTVSSATWHLHLQ
jgi:hypothetical protein